MKKIIKSIILMSILILTGMFGTKQFTVSSKSIYEVKAAEATTTEKINLTINGLEEGKITQGNSFTVIANMDDYENKKIVGDFNWKITSSKVDGDVSSLFTMSYSGASNSVVEVTTKKKSSGTIYISCSVDYSDAEEKINHISSEVISVTISLKQSTIAEIIASVLNQRAVIIFIVGLAGAVLWNTGYRIYRFGVIHKSDYATKEEQQKFENETREQQRKNKEEILEFTLKYCLREIDNKTKPISSLQDTAEKMKTNNAAIDLKLKTIDEKVNDINRISESVRTLDSKVTRIQYGESANETRRSGK